MKEIEEILLVSKYFKKLWAPMGSLFPQQCPSNIKMNNFKNLRGFKVPTTWTKEETLPNRTRNPNNIRILSLETNPQKMRRKKELNKSKRNMLSNFNSKLLKGSKTRQFPRKEEVQVNLFLSNIALICLYQNNLTFNNLKPFTITRNLLRKMCLITL